MKVFQRQLQKKKKRKQDLNATDILCCKTKEEREMKELNYKASTFRIYISLLSL